MGSIELPDSMFADRDPAPAVPPPDPAVAREQAIADTTRAEEALNGFLAARQQALFEAPDAFYRTQGSDAIHAAPVILGKLAQLRDDSLDGLANDAQRNRLGRSLDAHMQLARDDIARHVAEQSLAWQRQTAQDRIALLTKEAAYHHNDDGRLDTLGIAAANAARAHARVGDTPLDQQAEDAAAATARSGVLGSAIQARLDRGNLEGANALLTRGNDQLDPVRAVPLQQQLGVVPNPIEPVSTDNESPSAQNLPLDETQIAKAPDVPAKPASSATAKQQKPVQQAPQKRAIPPEEIVYPTDAEKKQMVEAQRRWSIWAGMIRAPYVENSNPNRRQELIPDNWEERVDKIDPRYSSWTRDAAEKNGIPPKLLARLLFQESHYDKDKKSESGALGIGQFTPGGVKGLGLDPNTFPYRDPKTSIDAAASYLGQQYRAFKNWPKAIAAYNFGGGALSSYLDGSGVDYETIRGSDDRSANAKGRWAQLKAHLSAIFRGDPEAFDK